MEYPEETLDSSEDDGTMVQNVQMLRNNVVGHRIIAVDFNVPVPGSWRTKFGVGLTLDNGKAVVLVDTNDCCAHTSLEAIIPHLDKIGHVITGVGTTDGYTRWHIYADLGDVLELTVGWSAGNPFYYGYGFDIAVLEV